MRHFVAIISISVLLLTLFASCSKYEQVDIEPIELPIRLAVQAGSDLRRAPSDPGTAEHFDIPEHIYFYLVATDSLGNTSVEQLIDTLLAAEEWQLTTLTDGEKAYTWDGRIVRMLPAGWQTVSIYAAASAVSLDIPTPTPTTEDDVRNVQFTVTADLQQNLQNLYATPSTLQKDDKYYCTYSRGESRLLQTTVLLYHVAAKVDLNWTVQADIRDKLQLTYMQATNLYCGNAYLFKPLANTATEQSTTGFNYEIINHNIGMQWEGRAYFYTIPYMVDGRFPLQIDCKQNDDDNLYHITLLKNMETADAAFAPWIRGNLNFSHRLTTQTIEVE